MLGARSKRSSGMKQSDRSVLGAALIFLLVLTTCTYILLIVSNNRPLFAQIRVLVHGRTSTRELIVDQNLKSGDISTRARIQRNSLPISRVLNMTASNLHIDDTPSVASENNNADISNQFKKGMRMALVEPTFTAAAYNNSFYVFYQKYSHVSAETNITNDLSLLSSRVIKYPTITPTTKVHSAFAMLSLLKNFKLVSPGSNITVLTDADIDDGLIFENRGGSVDINSNAYDVVILGHQEYVTQREYN